MNRQRLFSSDAQLKANIVLIGNYPPDRQQSMERFTVMLANGLRKSDVTVEVWKPTVCFGRIAKSTISGFGKWLGYIDKWILFPIVLRLMRWKYKAYRFHICDHSNAPYLAHLPQARSSITCHDVLAIRGAIGHADAYCPASRMGKILQRWILSNLLRAQHVASVSDMTMRQLTQLANRDLPREGWSVILNGFNAPFSPIPIDIANQQLEPFGITESTRFILHVGSDLTRKNRGALLDMVVAIGAAWDGVICFAGHPMENQLRSKAQSLGLTDRIIEVLSPDHETLVALYSRCDAFIFPSYSEGFGWPVIEAQACGAPVIASNIEPMPEVSGGAAIHASPDNVQEFVDAFIRLQNPTERETLIQRGFENCKRFEVDIMIEKYRKLILGEDGCTGSNVDATRSR
jgi:glycosyltransferase involved in cell wall biosynthesis